MARMVSSSRPADRWHRAAPARRRPRPRRGRRGRSALRGWRAAGVSSKKAGAGVMWRCELVELGAARVFLLEGDDLAQALPDRRRRRRVRPPLRARLPRRSTRLRIRKGLRPTASRNGSSASASQPLAHASATSDGRHQDGDEGRRHGVGEEILDQLDVVRGERHQIAGAPAHQIGRRQRVELAEGVDAHLGQQAEGHVVGQPGLEPVQDARQGRRWRAPMA